MKELAPTKDMLSMSTAEYIIAFQKRLDALDPQVVFDSLGDNTVMLCWESPGVFCHRRAVAQWLESSLGIVIPEFGFDRDAIPTYPHMPEKDSVEAKQLAKQLAKKKPVSYIPTLLS